MRFRLALFLHTGLAASAALSGRTTPTVTLDNGTFVGTTEGVVDKFLGIPFGKPPCVLAYLFTDIAAY